VDLLLAHGGLSDDGGSLAISIVAVVAMTIPLFVLGVVSWIFLKQKRREDAERKALGEWRNARSS
jgi:hypothetical protein